MVHMCLFCDISFYKYLLKYTQNKVDNDGGMFIRKTYKIVTLYIHILINFLSVIHIHKTVTI